MNESPWYMRTVDPGDITKGSPEAKRKHLESIAATASAEDDAMVARLKAVEARGVEISATTRMAMGYATVARKAAAQLGETSQRQTSVSDAELTPEQRIARGYGTSN
ncbi:hypothetical protein OIE62_11585 [Streptomyces scopuliridis]|uniref:Uncharacterized protein n=1 Tax=Streptomyces scopuliridis TaxID=452529 RepID=A0ACD4ZQW7_9ACTN|nr:hypothetical protein [Streptomyces scopuliridis]WSC00794.1 hypothetical protein OG835_29810 [Streptomyces scopuliridis]WSC05595.1 hypothetical protein OIE62_11585 [Streptomyces scopuliridis]